MLAILQGSISLGLIWAVMAMGVFLTFRILKSPDLTVEGSIILGAGLCARMIANGANPFLATFLAALLGCAAGFVTGALHTKLKIPAILAGILTMIGSYSIVIRVMGTSNISLLRLTTVYTFLENMGLSGRNAVIVLGLIIVAIIITVLYWFFGTELGSAIRATGNNRDMVRAQGINIDAMIILCLMISNGLVAMSGALVAQNQSFASVDMGSGTIVIGLASVIIAEVLFNTRSFWGRLVSLVVGAILYRLIIALVLEFGMAPTDLRLFQAITVAIALSLPMIRERLAKIVFVGGSKNA
ncbi:MAG: ABC transporter permease [Defluviitaleaceae bacterium]|nr:ABC transporter permease [Defluviitaleaceae bacterium]